MNEDGSIRKFLKMLGVSAQHEIEKAVRQTSMAATRLDDCLAHCCYAWNTLIDQPWKNGTGVDFGLQVTVLCTAKLIAGSA
jgi:Family of unknown function (DUF6494)